MKPKSIVIGLLSVTLLTTAHAGSLGTLVLGGSGCVEGAGEQKLTSVHAQPDTYKIPLQVEITKRADVTLMRKSCNFRLPVAVAADEKVVVSNVSQWVRLGASKGGQVKTSLEIFLAGGHGNPLTTEVNAVDKLSRVFQTVRSEGVVAESACGQAAIVSGNLSANATGMAQATTAVGALQLKIQIVKCN